MALFRRFWAFVFRKMGWTIVNPEPLQQLKQSMIALGPHTSWRDLLIGLISQRAIGVKIRYIAKHTLFRFPLGILLRSLGGSPVNRSIRSGLVDQVVELYKSHEDYHLCITPEGTRERVSRFRTGFYRIAIQAGVPLVLAKFDYASKTLTFSDPFFPSDDKDADFDKIYAFFDGVLGYHPEKSFFLNK